MLAAGETGLLSELWGRAVERVSRGVDETVWKVLVQAGDALKVDGEVVDCDPELPARFITQAWRHAQGRKGREFRGLVDRLVRKLSDILRAAFAHSAAGQAPAALAASIGSAPAHGVAFAAMSTPF